MTFRLSEIRWRVVKLGTDVNRCWLDSLREVGVKPFLPRSKHIQSAVLQSPIFKHRVLRPGHLGREFVRAGHIQSDGCVRRLKDFAGEFVPGAAAFCRGMVEAIGVRLAQANDLLCNSTVEVGVTNSLSTTRTLPRALSPAST